jgi:DnaJ-class molecular chaperone
MLVECPKCSGTGKDEREPCPTCGGSGSIPQREAVELELDRDHVVHLPDGLAR